MISNLDRWRVIIVDAAPTPMAAKIKWWCSLFLSYIQPNLDPFVISLETIKKHQFTRVLLYWLPT